jgi:serine phosphatase RsbU (regulator of sigma subunit)
MSEPTAHFAASYRSTLEKYVETGEEHQLEEAFALGREAFGDGVTLLSLLDLHRTSVEILLRRTPSASGATAAAPTSASTRIDATFQMLAEALATFEMAQRGYWETQEAMRRERAIALMLQRDLMPAAPPDVAGLDIAVRYIPGETGTHAGGDWYDVFELDDGRVGLVVGDITGHGVGAAAAMGQLRIAVLAYALGGQEPANVLEDVDLLLHRLGASDIATMTYVVLDRDAPGLVMSSAGHPPPLLVAADGTASLWSDGRGRLVGVSPPARGRTQAVADYPAGSHLVLYTDGLVEPLERAGDDGVARLRDVAEGFSGTADQLCDRLLAELAPDGARDDICVLALTHRPT